MLGAGIVVFHRLLNSCWSLLLVVSYLWGGCVSCQQLFMPQAAKSHCCDEKRCKHPVQKSSDPSGSQTTPQDCQVMPMERSSAAQSHSDLATPAWIAGVAAIPAPDVIEIGRSHTRAAVDFDPHLPPIGAALRI